MIQNKIKFFGIFFIVLIVVIFAMVLAPSIIEPTSVKNSRLAQETLSHIYYGEKVFQRLNNNQFGTLEQLARQGLIKGFEGNLKNGYRFDISELNKSFVIVASPVKDGSKYYLDENGLIHLGSEDGAICLPNGTVLGKTINDSGVENETLKK